MLTTVEEPASEGGSKDDIFSWVLRTLDDNSEKTPKRGRSLLNQSGATVNLERMQTFYGGPAILSDKDRARMKEARMMMDAEEEQCGNGDRFWGLDCEAEAQQEAIQFMVQEDIRGSLIRAESARAKREKLQHEKDAERTAADERARKAFEDDAQLAYLKLFYESGTPLVALNYVWPRAAGAGEISTTPPQIHRKKQKWKGPVHEPEFVPSPPTWTGAVTATKSPYTATPSTHRTLPSPVPLTTLPHPKANYNTKNNSPSNVNNNNSSINNSGVVHVNKSAAATSNNITLSPSGGTGGTVLTSQTSSVEGSAAAFKANAKVYQIKYGGAQGGRGAYRREFSSAAHVVDPTAEEAALIRWFSMLNARGTGRLRVSELIRHLTSAVSRNTITTYSHNHQHNPTAKSTASNASAVLRGTLLWSLVKKRNSGAIQKWIADTDLPPVNTNSTDIENKEVNNINGESHNGDLSAQDRPSTAQSTASLTMSCDDFLRRYRTLWTEKAVLPKHIRRLGGGLQVAPGNERSKLVRIRHAVLTTFVVGDVVEALMQQSCRWYRAEIIATNMDGTYDVSYVGTPQRQMRSRSPLKSRESSALKTSKLSSVGTSTISEAPSSTIIKLKDKLQEHVEQPALDVAIVSHLAKSSKDEGSNDGGGSVGSESYEDEFMSDTESRAASHASTPATSARASLIDKSKQKESSSGVNVEEKNSGSMPSSAQQTAVAPAHSKESLANTRQSSNQFEDTHMPPPPVFLGENEESVTAALALWDRVASMGIPPFEGVARPSRFASQCAASLAHVADKISYGTNREQEARELCNALEEVLELNAVEWDTS